MTEKRTGRFDVTVNRKTGEVTLTWTGPYGTIYTPSVLPKNDAKQLVGDLLEALDFDIR